MGASDLPLGIRQRIEQRWSAQIKRLQQERDLKDLEHLKSKPRDDGASVGLRAADVNGCVHIAEWCKHRSS